MEFNSAGNQAVVVEYIHMAFKRKKKDKGTIIRPSQIPIKAASLIRSKL